MNNAEWIKEIDYKDLLQADPVLSLVSQECDEDVALALALKFTKMTIYVSEKFLNAAKKRYARKYYDRENPNARMLAIKLHTSEKFIYEAIAETDKKDDRQGSLL